MHQQFGNGLPLIVGNHKWNPVLNIPGLDAFINNNIIF
jgi:hypothetical protein